MKPILYIDIDDTLAQYKKAWLSKVSIDQPYPQSVEGYYLNLEPIENAIESVIKLSEWFDVYFLTAPSLKNPISYTEKRLWIEKWFGFDYCDKLIICNHKELLIGDYLIDDNITGKGQDKFKGKLIHFGSPQFEDWNSIISYFNLDN